MKFSRSVKTSFGIVLIFLVGISKLAAQEVSWIDERIDFSHIESRKDSFLMKQSGKASGHWVWETIKNDRQITFKDISVLDGIVEERFKMVFDFHELVTKSVNLILKTKELKIEAQISRKRNTDLKAAYKLSGTMSRVKHIDTTYSNEVIIRPEIFGLLPGMVQPTDLNESFDAFFLSIGTLESMTLKYDGEQKITVPAGTFDTYKVKLESEKAISNTIYLTKTKPHCIVKVDVIGQELEIVKI